MESRLPFEVCAECKRPLSEQEFSSWFGRYDDENFIYEMICPECQKNHPDEGFVTELKLGPAWNSAPPLTGNFKPVSDAMVVSKRRADSYLEDIWLNLESHIWEVFDEWPDKVLKFSVSSYLYKGYWLRPIYVTGHPVALEVSGDTPAKKLELDVYQAHRLRKMGFTPIGKSNIVWRIEFAPHEQSNENLTRVISHVMRYAFMFQPQRIDDLIPTLDIDARDYPKQT